MTLEELLSRHGIRPTPNRLLVARALEESGRPVSMSELETAIDSIDKSGIFRTLVLFRDKHLVHVLEDGGDGARYELCHSHDSEHDDDLHVHFYCEKCRKTFCLEDIHIPRVSLPQGWSAHTVNYMIKGVCPSCSRA
ncbi:MAG: transcriptional repressor [Bacteroidales bacterium]|nr:transcriptional repressor [Bacteroidales bacterium]